MYFGLEGVHEQNGTHRLSFAHNYEHFDVFSCRSFSGLVAFIFLRESQNIILVIFPWKMQGLTSDDNQRALRAKVSAGELVGRKCKMNSTVSYDKDQDRAAHHPVRNKSAVNKLSAVYLMVDLFTSNRR